MVILTNFQSKAGIDGLDIVSLCLQPTPLPMDSTPQCSDGSSSEEYTTSSETEDATQNWQDDYDQHSTGSSSSDSAGMYQDYYEE